MAGAATEHRGYARSMHPGTDDDAVEDRRSAAKRPANLAAGMHGQPLHPLFVTFPIGAWVTSFLFDLAAHYAHDEFVYSRAAFWLIGVGIVGGFAAAATGTIDLLNVPRRTVAFRTGVTHLVLSDIVLVAFVVSFLVRRGDASIEAAPVPVMLLSVVALGFLAVSSWLGVRLAFRYGIRVVDEATQSEGFALIDAEPNPDGGSRQDVVDGDGDGDGDGGGGGGEVDTPSEEADVATGTGDENEPARST